MVVLSPPPLISPEGYFYTSEPLTASEDIGDDLTNAPAGYPGTVAVLDGPPPPTLIRMWQGPSNGQQGWSAYQPMPNDPSMHPNWNQGPPPPMPPPGGPKKRAFICGINYLGLSCRLNGVLISCLLRNACIGEDVFLFLLSAVAR